MLGRTRLNALCVVVVSGAFLRIGTLMPGVSACGGGSSSASTAVVVPPSYTLLAGALNPGSVTAANRSTSTIKLTPTNGYTASVSLSCGIISGGIHTPGCSFSPPSVTISDVNPGSSTLTVSTSTNTPGGIYAISATASDANKLAPRNGAQALTLTTAAVIEHVVIIFQQNRSPDNLIQDPVLISRGADIASSSKNSLGQIISLMPIDLGTSGAKPQNYDLGHGHSNFVAMCDGGKMDGENLITCTPTAQCPPNAHPNAQFMYVNPSDVQPYFALADRMFQTNQDPSFPTHQFIISGTSAPTATGSLFAAENPIVSATSPAGCIAP